LPGNKFYSVNFNKRFVRNTITAYKSRFSFPNHFQERCNRANTTITTKSLNQSLENAEIEKILFDKSKLEICVQTKLAFLLCIHDAHFLILAYTFLEKVGFSFQRNIFHEIERILHVVDLFTLKLQE